MADEGRSKYGTSEARLAEIQLMPDVAKMLTEFRNARYTRRIEIMHSFYVGAEGRSGLLITEIADLVGMADSSVSRGIRRWVQRVQGTVARDEEYLRSVVQNTIAAVEDIHETNELLEGELDDALANRTMRGRANYINGLVANLRGNRELQARLLRLLDPKVEVTVRTERALRMQEAIMKALSQIDPETADKVMAMAESIMAAEELQG